MQLDISPFGKFSAYRFFDKVEGLSFTIIPEHGALLSDFRFQHQVILDGCPTPESVDFNDWGKSWLLFPFPNRLKDGQYEWQGKSYQFPINDGQNNHALHGFLHECVFDVVSTETTDNQANISLRYNYNGERDYYPFPFAFNITYQLTTAGKLNIECFVENTGTTTLPMGLGWHPYFQLSDSVNNTHIQTPLLKMLGIDQRMIPTGKQYNFDKFITKKKIGLELLDNCFAFAKTAPGNVSTFLEKDNVQIEFWQDASKFPFLQIFTPSHRQSIAIEPMTCNVDAFNNQEGLIELEVGENWQGSFGFRVRRVD